MSRSVSVRSGSIEFLKVNTERWELRDAYQWLLALSWPRFAAFLAAIYIVINLIFATLYFVGGDSIAGLTPGSFADAFFFSVETLATVGYGHMYPATLYGHIVTTIEIVNGMFYLAVITGLIFVRFSRPTARVLFSERIVIGPFNGQSALMLRVGNLRESTLVEAEFRIMFTRDEPILEGEDFRHFYNLKLAFDRLVAFPAALTLRHIIDETSPLHGQTIESLEKSRATLVASLVAIETVIPAVVQTHHHYSWRDIRFGQRFVEIYTEHGDGKLTVDFGRIHDTEAVKP
ncbi:MAG: inward rectifier potassium channel [Verrucomicrobiota bacterium]